MANPRAGMSGPYESMQWTISAPRTHAGAYALDFTTVSVMSLSASASGVTAPSGSVSPRTPPSGVATAI